jgi:nucleoid DNA-binding protein
MRKLDIVTRINRQVGIPEREAAKLVDRLLELLKTTLQQGEPTAISNFGKFTVRRKAARLGRNSRTGEAVIIPAYRAVTFYASRSLKDEVNFVPREVNIRLAD